MAVRSPIAGRVGIVAGGGQIPVHLAMQVSKTGSPPFLVLLEGEADPSLTEYEHVSIGTAAIGKLVAALKAAGVKTVCIVGSVAGRPDLRQFRPDIITLKTLPQILRRLGAGDDALLRGVVEMLEREGFTVVGAHELATDLLASRGLIAGKMPTKAVRTSIDLGMKAAMALGRLDAGQGVVVIGKRIVALEGVEGTDAMLMRVADLKRSGRLADKPGGVLIKASKPGQETRTDLPTIGIATIDSAAAAKLQGIVLEAEKSLIVDLPAVRGKAVDAGMFIYGTVADPSGEVH